MVAGCVALGIATFAAYFGALSNDFVEFDGNLYVKYNPQTAAGLTPSGFCYAWTTFETGNWFPLIWLSFQADATLFGMNSMGFHATNILLYDMNVLLFFTWLVRVTGSRWRSLVAAGLFGLHPLNVESVAWVAERKDVLSTFWLLVTLHVYERYFHSPKHEMVHSDLSDLCIRTFVQVDAGHTSLVASARRFLAA